MNQEIVGYNKRSGRKYTILRKSYPGFMRSETRTPTNSPRVTYVLENNIVILKPDKVLPRKEHELGKQIPYSIAYRAGNQHQHRQVLEDPVSIDFIRLRGDIDTLIKSTFYTANTSNYPELLDEIMDSIKKATT